MKLKASSRYMMRELLVSTAWFYGTMLAIYVVGYTLIAVSGARGSMSGYDFASVIFLFVVGLNSFKECFGLMIQNGVSRKTMFVGRMASFAVTALLVTVANLLLTALTRLFPFVLPVVEVSVSFLGNAFFFTLYNLSGPGAVALSLLTSFALLFLFLALGYCIATLFYRLNTTGKIAVGAGVPTFLFLILPLVDFRFLDGRVIRAIGRFFLFALGLDANRPWMPAVSFLVSGALFALFSWLLVRRATVHR